MYRYNLLQYLPIIDVLIVFASLFVLCFLLLFLQQGTYFFSCPNQQLKKLKNAMFDCFSWIWYNIIKEGASGMKEKE